MRVTGIRIGWHRENDGVLDFFRRGQDTIRHPVFYQGCHGLMSSPKVLLIEFNELCPPLLNKWMDEGLLPNFRRFASQSQVFVTEADEPEGLSLNPWIQWYSLHTGLPYSSHGVFRLTDGLRKQHDDLWSVLSDAGVSVANMSSMNARWSVERAGFYVPDPWCGKEPPHPPELAPYHKFVSSQVQQHSTGEGSRLGEATGFLMFMAAHGLRLRTAWAVLRQLTDEVVTRGRSSWRRASLLDLFQFDVFSHYLRRYRSQFATFFVNSTAHYQHCYWRHMAPEQFVVQPTPEDLERYKDAILFGYQKMDALLEDFFKLENDGYTLILATALSQQPYLAAEDRGGQLYYRPHDFAGFLKSHGISYAQLEPVMAQQFVLRFADRQATEKAARQLRGFEWNGAQIIEVAESGECSLTVGNWLHGPIPEDAVMVRQPEGTTEQYYDVFYLMEAMKSGRHHREGVLWIKTGEHKVHSSNVSILDVFPTVLAMLGVRVPERHRGPQHSLLAMGKSAASRMEQPAGMQESVARNA